MSRKPAAKKTAKKSTAKKTAKAPPKPKPRKVYLAVREMEQVNRSYTEPDRVFASRKAAQEHAAALNRDLRALTNPFADEREPGFIMSDEDKLWALLKTFNIAEPKAPKGGYIRWDKWWAQVAAELTEEQRDAVWNLFDEYEWYKVKQTTLED